MKKLLLSLLLLLVTAPIGAFAAEHRIALVVGNANYQTGALPTPANDAGLIAQTLQAAGFDVTGARDLNQEALRQAFRDFLDKAGASGADTVAYIYLSGYGLQLEDENYFAPIDARIASDANVPSEALRLSDYLKPLAALHLKANIVVLDLARANPYAKSGSPLPGGLALVEPDASSLIAFNAAPGTVGPNEAGPYSAYAQALAEISREGGVGIDDVFTRVRLRVNQLTNGAEVPWQSAKLDAPLYLFDKASDAPAPAVSPEQTSSIRSKPIREFDAGDAYLAALDRDTLQGYLDFVAAFPSDPMAPRVRAIIAARREALIWRRTRNNDTPRAYWSYLRRYPRGAHSYDARRRLRALAAAFEPPPSFEVIEYDVPPPPPDEIIYVERPVLVFDDPDFDFVPPPPPPVMFLPPPPVYFVDLPPPPPPLIAFMLPMPEYRPIPVWVTQPEQIAPPPANIIYNNVHNTVVINNTTNMVTITNPQGQTQTVSPAVAAAPLNKSISSAPATSTAAPSGAGKIAAGVAAVGAAAILAPSLPTSLAKKAATTPNPQPVAPAKPLAPGRILRVQSTAPAVSPSLTGPSASPSKIQTAPTQPTLPKPTPAAPTAVAPPKASTQQPGASQLGKPLPGTPGGQALPASPPKTPAGAPSLAKPTTAAPTAATPSKNSIQRPGASQLGKPLPGTPGGQALPASPSKTPPSAPSLAKPTTAAPTAIAPQKPSPQHPGKSQPGPLPGTPGGQALPTSRSKVPPTAVQRSGAPATPSASKAGTAPREIAPKSTMPSSRAVPPKNPPRTTRPMPAPQVAPAGPKIKQAPVVNAPRAPSAPVRHAPQPTQQQKAPPPQATRAAPVHAPPPVRPMAPAQARPIAPKPNPPPAARQASPPQARPATPKPAAPAAAAKPAPKGCVLPDGKPCPKR
jgi:uncharacterized caspase-like protein